MKVIEVELKSGFRLQQPSNSEMNADWNEAQNKSCPNVAEQKKLPA